MGKQNSGLEDEIVIEKIREKIKPPSMYKVILNNDDFTPMDFVVEVLQKFFSLQTEEATQIMLTVHHQGRAVCGVYSAEVAETKVMQVNRYAKEYEYPLLCTMEKE